MSSCNFKLSGGNLAKVIILAMITYVTSFDLKFVVGQLKYCSEPCMLNRVLQLRTGYSSRLKNRGYRDLSFLYFVYWLQVTHVVPAHVPFQ